MTAPSASDLASVIAESRRVYEMNLTRRQDRARNLKAIKILPGELNVKNVRRLAGHPRLHYRELDSAALRDIQLAHGFKISSNTRL